MQNNIDKVELLLENCEVITIEGKHIGEFCIDNINHRIERVTCNSIQEIHIAKHFSISIHRDANIEKSMPIDGKMKKFSRLHNCHDIVCVYVYLKQDWFKKQKVKCFYVDWYHDRNDSNTTWVNKNQKTHMNQFGDLFITVDRNRNIDDIFNLEQIEDEQHMSFVWKMYGVEKV